MERAIYMLNPAEVYKLAKLASEKNSLSTKVYQHITDKEEEMSILTLANTMEDDLGVQIMQSAQKGDMRFPISDLAYVESFAGLSNSVINDVLLTMVSLVRHVKNYVPNNVELDEYPIILRKMLIENTQYTSRLNTNQAKVPSFAFLEALIRFKKAGFLVKPTFEFGQKINIYIRWGGEDFIPPSTNVDTRSLANIKIAELMSIVAGLRDIEKLQATCERLLEENKRLKDFVSVMTLNQSKKGNSDETESGKVP